MKIKFVANYDNDLNIYKSIINCFKLTADEKNLLTYDDDYDYLGIINGYNGQIKTPRERNFGFLQEPLGNINYDRNLHFYCKTIFCQLKDSFKADIIEAPLCMFYSNHTYYDNRNFDNLNFIKPKKICIFISGISSPNNPNWKNHNYYKRLNLVNKILESDLDIDIYGRNLNINDKRYKGAPENKHEILRNYTYSISIENVCEQNYVSEKFFDCILNNVVPIYYGCPNIDDIFNSDCYEKLDLESESVIDDIKSIISKENNKYHDAIYEAKNKYYLTFNPLKKIKEKTTYEIKHC